MFLKSFLYVLCAFCAFLCFCVYDVFWCVLCVWAKLPEIKLDDDDDDDCQEQNETVSNRTEISRALAYS